jgi:hypothetical protein
MSALSTPPAADRWYLQLAEGTRPRPLRRPAAVRRRRPQRRRQLPEPPHARWLRTLLNESQMVLHAAPGQPNGAKTPAGRRSTACGCGALGKLPAEPAPPDFAGVWSDNPLARGWRAPPAYRCMRPGDAGMLLAHATPAAVQLVVLDDAAVAGAVRRRRRLPHGARIARQRWFAPLQKALAAGKISTLNIEATTVYAALRWDSDRAGPVEILEEAATTRRSGARTGQNESSDPRSRRASSGNLSNRACIPLLARIYAARGIRRGASSTTNSSR